MAPDGDLGQSDDASPSKLSMLHKGALLGAVSAVAYSLANLALRQLSDSRSAGGSGWDLWVTATKTLPTATVAWLLVLRRAVRGQPALPPLKLLPGLLLAAVVMQFGGNLAFQTALSYLGLGITVPFVFACIICVGAVAGRVVLGDSITTQVVSAMVVMMVAIVLLSAGTMSMDMSPAGTSSAARESTANAAVSSPAGPTGQILVGILVAAVSGCSYGLTGVLVRSFVRTKLSVESTLIVLSTTGAVSLATLGIASSGWQPLRDVTAAVWPVILAAGIANAVAFFSVAHAFRFMDVNRMNVINASQNAMCAVGAVLLFHEPLNGLALSGIGLTIAGLTLLGWRRQRR